MIRGSYEDNKEELKESREPDGIDGAKGPGVAMAAHEDELVGVLAALDRGNNVPDGSDRVVHLDGHANWNMSNNPNPTEEKEDLELVRPPRG